MERVLVSRPSAVRLRLLEYGRSLAADRVRLSLGVVFLLVSSFYVLTAGTSKPLTLHAGPAEPYNQLANAFLHLHLSVGRAPAALLRLADPYDPAQNTAIQTRFSIHDFALYHGNLFLTWGPAPVVALLLPMRLLGLEPSSSVAVSIFAIVGLGFSLATLRVLLRQIGTTTLWLCVLGGLTLALCSAVPYILRHPAVYEEAISGGYCFAMAGIWLAVSALAERRASLVRLVLMSLCFGLATGSRPTLGLAALVLVPVYTALRSTRPRRGLLLALIAPVGVCLLLLMAYNQARFGSPLEWGEKYVLSDENSYTAHWMQPSYVLPGVWLYTMSPPRPLALFPFLELTPPPVTYPLGLPPHYLSNAPTGGILPMAPIVVFLAALPWIWRRRPRLLGSLAAPLLILAGAGVACMLFLAYQFYSTTERYAVDFTTLFLLGAVAAWLALSAQARGRWRWLVRASGSLLVIWGCAAGLAISFTGIENLLARSLPGVWTTLQSIGAPISTAIVTIAGRPVLAEVSSPNLSPSAHVRYAALSTNAAAFWLSPGEQADLTIVSPEVSEAALRAKVMPGPALGRGASLWVVIGGVGHTTSSHLLPARGGVVRIPVPLSLGVNRLALSPLASALEPAGLSAPSAQPLLEVTDLSLASYRSRQALRPALSVR
jgi:hypothetical protein